MCAAWSAGIVSVSLVLQAQQPASAQGAGAAGPADTILTNGKIITVDETFSIAQAVAVRGSRIVAVGTNQEITRLAGPNTRRIDLRGRSVVPGLIDNHAHFQEEGEYWTLEQRLDGVDTRKQALALLVAKAQGEGCRAVGVHARRLVARPVQGRQEAVHPRRAGQVPAEQSGAAAVHPRRDLSQ